MSEAMNMIPREQLSRFKSWKPDDFSLERRSKNGTELMTVEQLEQLHEQVRAEGYAAGYQQGSEQAARELGYLRSLMSDLDRELRRFDQGVANNLVSLAFEMTRQILRTSLTQRPELVVDVVKEAMQSLPPFGEHAQLLLNPKDAALVRVHLGEQLTHAKWKLVDDPSIECGGCKVQTASIEIDATLPVRWQRMAASLARNDVWYQKAASEGVTP